MRFEITPETVRQKKKLTKWDAIKRFAYGTYLRSELDISVVSDKPKMVQVGGEPFTQHEFIEEVDGFLKTPKLHGQSVFLWVYHNRIADSDTLPILYEYFSSVKPNLIPPKAFFAIDENVDNVLLTFLKLCKEERRDLSPKQTFDMWDVNEYRSWVNFKKLQSDDLDEIEKERIRKVLISLIGLTLALSPSLTQAKLLNTQRKIIKHLQKNQQLRNYQSIKLTQLDSALRSKLYNQLSIRLLFIALLLGALILIILAWTSYTQQGEDKPLNNVQTPPSHSQVVENRIKAHIYLLKRSCLYEHGGHKKYELWWRAELKKLKTDSIKIALIDSLIKSCATSNLYWEKARLHKRLNQHDSALINLSVCLESMRRDPTYDFSILKLPMSERRRHGNRIQSIYYDLAENYAQLEEYNQAVTYIDSAILYYVPLGTKPYDWLPIYYHKRSIYKQPLGDNLKALEDIELAISLHSSNLALLSDRGNIYRNLKLFDKAISDYQISLDTVKYYSKVFPGFLENSISEQFYHISDCYYQLANGDQLWNEGHRNKYVPGTKIGEHLTNARTYADSCLSHELRHSKAKTIWNKCNQMLAD